MSVHNKPRYRVPNKKVSSDSPRRWGSALPVVGLFIPDLLKGKEPRWSKHIPKVPKMLVFTRNFETRKEYDYGKAHYEETLQGSRSIGKEGLSS